MAWYYIVLIVLACIAGWLGLSALFYRQFFKRFYDIVLSGLALIVLSPVLLILTILGAIKMKGNPSVSAGLYLIFDSFIKKPGKISSFVFWMSKNSFTIYIFHIYFMWFVFLLERVIPSFNSVGWFFKYIFVVLFSIISCKAFLSFKNIVLISRMDKK